MTNKPSKTHNFHIEFLFCLMNYLFFQTISTLQKIYISNMQKFEIKKNIYFMKLSIFIYLNSVLLLRKSPTLKNLNEKRQELHKKWIRRTNIWREIQLRAWKGNWNYLFESHTGNPENPWWKEKLDNRIKITVLLSLQSNTPQTSPKEKKTL